MRALSAEGLLAVWERGLEQLPLERALTLLEAACPESDPQTLAGMSIGCRDARLLTLREWAFGSRMTGCAVCQRCGQTLEISLQVADLRQDPGKAEAADSPLSVAGYEVLFRFLNSLDLAACAGADPDEIPRRLFARCLIALKSGNETPSHDQVPDTVVQTIMESIVKADTQSNLEIVISCAACGHNSSEAFDIVSFFWIEIDSWARRVLREVHLLASAYGWPEHDILALSPLRRQFYLEMASA